MSFLNTSASPGACPGSATQAQKSLAPSELAAEAGMIVVYFPDVWNERAAGLGRLGPKLLRKASALQD